MTNEVAVRRTQICLCCSASWESNHDRGPLLCSPCFMSMSWMDSPRHSTTCKIHYKTVDAGDVCPPATLTNGPYVPLVAR